MWNACCVSGIILNGLHVSFNIYITTRDGYWNYPYFTDGETESESCCLLQAIINPLKGQDAMGNLLQVHSCDCWKVLVPCQVGISAGMLHNMVAGLLQGEQSKGEWGSLPKKKAQGFLYLNHGNDFPALSRWPDSKSFLLTIALNFLSNMVWDSDANQQRPWSKFEHRNRETYVLVF